MKSKAAEIELRLEKAQWKTAQAKAYFASFVVGDRVEVTTQVEFKDVADLAERMHRVWTDARR